MIICDYQGSCIAASSRVLLASYSAKITKAIALQEGELLASEMGISHVIFESNALSIIQAINESHLGGELGHTIQSIRDTSLSFSWYSFQHLKRNGNKVAHELPKSARISNVSQVWKGVIPSLVEHLIFEDLYL